MALTDLNITESYAALNILRQSQLNAAMTSIEAYVNANVKLNFQQIGLDVFGNTYSWNNDGLQTVATPIFSALGNLGENETVTGSWTFSGTAAFSNTVNFSGNVNGSAQPRCKAILITANQSIPDSLFTAIAFNGEAYDIGTMHDLAVNIDRITIPSGGSGLYHLTAQVRFTANATGRREIAIFKNGVELSRSVDQAASAGQKSFLQIAVQDQGTVGDFYNVQVYQNSGGALDVEFAAAGNATYFQAAKGW